LVAVVTASVLARVWLLALVPLALVPLALVPLARAL
jgi:hypothetical protein